MLETELSKALLYRDRQRIVTLQNVSAGSKKLWKENIEIVYANSVSFHPRVKCFVICYEKINRNSWITFGLYDALSTAKRSCMRVSVDWNLRAGWREMMKVLCKFLCLGRRFDEIFLFKQLFSALMLKFIKTWLMTSKNGVRNQTIIKSWNKKIFSQLN